MHILQYFQTQLCIVNPNCIKGYFKALNPVPDYPIP